MLTTKDRILSVLVDHIKTGTNLSNLSLSQIAAEAEIGKSTVYEYFSSKDEMILATYTYLLDTYHQILLSDLTHSDFKNAFIEQISRILTVMKDAKNIMDAIMNNNKTPFPIFSNHLDACMKDIQSKMDGRFKYIMETGVMEGILPNREPHPFAKNVIQAIISGLLFQFVNQEIKCTEDQLMTLIYPDRKSVV